MAVQKIVIEVPLKNEKDKDKARKVTFVAKGVTKVEFEQENGKVVIIGEGVDPVSVTKLLRKKLGYALLESVTNVEEHQES